MQAGLGAAAHRLEHEAALTAGRLWADNRHCMIDVCCVRPLQNKGRKQTGNAASRGLLSKARPMA